MLQRLGYFISLYSLYIFVQSLLLSMDRCKFGSFTEIVLENKSLLIYEKVSHLHLNTLSFFTELSGPPMKKAQMFYKLHKLDKETKLIYKSFTLELGSIAFYPKKTVNK